MSKEYEKMQKDYATALEASKTGDAGAREAKGRIMAQIRQAERESAREGTVLNPVMKRGAIVVETTKTSSRRSLQEEYVRKFNDKVPVKIDTRDGSAFVGTLREFHAKRLLAR